VPDARCACVMQIGVTRKMRGRCAETKTAADKRCANRDTMSAAMRDMRETRASVATRKRTQTKRKRYCPDLQTARQTQTKTRKRAVKGERRTSTSVRECRQNAQNANLKRRAKTRQTRNANAKPRGKTHPNSRRHAAKSRKSSQQTQHDNQTQQVPEMDQVSARAEATCAQYKRAGVTMANAYVA